MFVRYYAAPIDRNEYFSEEGKNIEWKLIIY